MQLVYNPAKNPMVKSLAFTMAKVTLKAGVNSFTPAQAKAIKTHPDYDKFIELGVFAEDVEDEPVKPKTTRRKSNPILLDMPEK